MFFRIATPAGGRSSSRSGPGTPALVTTRTLWPDGIGEERINLGTITTSATAIQITNHHKATGEALFRVVDSAVWTTRAANLDA